MIKMMNFLLFVIVTIWNISGISCDLKIEVMKEGLTDLKTTILKAPNITNFQGSSMDPYIGGTIGELVPFNPIDGCSPLQESKYTVVDETKTLKISTVNGKSNQIIVLLSRGGCTFNEKFKNVERIKGVVGVLIYNETPEELIPITPIEITNPDSNPPGFLIPNSLGLELLKKIIKYRGDPLSKGGSIPSEESDIITNESSNANIPYVEVTMTPRSIEESNRANDMIQLTLIAIIVILALAFGASVVVHMRSGNGPVSSRNGLNSDSNSEDGGRQNTLPPIDVEFLQKLPLKTFKRSQNQSQRKGSNSQESTNSNNNNNNNNNTHNASQLKAFGGLKSPDEKSACYFEMQEHDWPMNDGCPICLDEFNNQEVLNELPCGHCYHIACIQPWLQYRSPNCPLCKLDVREEYKDVDDAGEKGIGKKGGSASASGSGLEDATTPTDTRHSHAFDIKKIWNKLILKSSQIKRGQNLNSSNIPQMIEIQPVSSTAIPIEIPPRALVHDTISINNHHHNHAHGFDDTSLNNHNHNNNNHSHGSSNNSNNFHSVPL